MVLGNMVWEHEGQGEKYHEKESKDGGYTKGERGRSTGTARIDRISCP
jgi:hypothetical protein